METTDGHRWTQILAEEVAPSTGEPACRRKTFLSRANELRTGSRHRDFADQAQRLGVLQCLPGVGHAVASASSISTDIGLRHTRQSGSGEACCSESARSVRVE